MPPFLPILADGGIFFAFQHSTLPGRSVLFCLFIGSIFSWSVMVTKLRMVARAKAQSRNFLDLFRSHRKPLHIYETRLRFEGSPLFAVYRAGCKELTYHLLGSEEVDETFRARLEDAPRISPSQMRVVQTAMERAVGETALRLESQMILLATAVSGAPFLGLLGTVWGVMETFGDVAMAGSANLTAMAPGVSAALITTVTGLLVAIPAMFGYNFLVTSIRALIVQMDNFAAELASEFAHQYVNHGDTAYRR
jgi:biopolymer transport protein ExbB/TolQ